MKKIGLLFGLMISCWQVQADIAMVNVWSALAGNSQQLFMNGMEAKAIHEEMGASVSISADQDGDMHYVVSFPDWAAWGKFEDAGASNEAWQSFWQRVNKVGTAEISATYMLDMVTVAETQPASVVYSWDVDQGKTQDFVALTQLSKKMHERMGASIGILVDELGDVHYEMTFPSWEAWGKFQEKAASDKEWQAFYAETLMDSTANLIKVWRLNAM